MNFAKSVDAKYLGPAVMTSGAPSTSHADACSDTASRLTSILRRDLKLGPDVPISDSTPLLGGDYDLDSLDVLMLLTSVEKEFEIKIPNEAIRREAFNTVGTLAAYIDERLT